MPARAYRNSKEHSETFPFLPLSLSYPFPLSPFPPPHFLLPAPLPVPPPLFLPLSLSLPSFLPLLLPKCPSLSLSSCHSGNSPRGGRKSNPLIVSGLHFCESRGETKLASPRDCENSNMLTIRHLKNHPPRGECPEAPPRRCWR